MMFYNAAELLNLCDNNNISISDAMKNREIALLETTEDDINKRMTYSFDIMKNAVKRSLEESLKSMGGLIGGEAKKIYTRGKNTKPVCGSLMSNAIAYAMGIMEVNASMGLIVAAPTAGSCGVLPGVLISLQEEFTLSDAQMIEALINASAIGYLVSYNATVAGAEGGCQAEIGTASAMAASAATQIMGGSPKQCLDAASTALSNLMGLVCDPIAGLVEAPCQKRNAIGAANALTCAEISLSGIESIIPFDEVVDAMYKVGLSMPRELRETALGGIAATPTACRLCFSK